MLRTNLNSSLLDAIFFSLMVGLGESYFSAYALALGYSELTAGLASTLPLIGGGLLQLLTPYGVRYFKSYRRWVVLFAFLHSFCFLPFAWCAFKGAMPLGFFFFSLTIYWAFFMSGTPAWNPWVRSLIPKQIERRYFSKRSFYGTLATLFALMTAGFCLEWGKTKGATLFVFALLFTFSFIFRLLSTFFLSKQTEGKTTIRILPFKEMFRLLFSDRYGRIIFFVLFFKMAVYFSAPFFTPYMLRDVKMSYHVYMLILAASLIGKMFVMQILSRYLRHMRSEKLLLISSWGIVFIPIFWTFSKNAYYLFPLEIGSGILWGGFELGFFLTFFSHISVEKQTSLLTLFNFLHTFAMIVGTSLGALAFSHFNLHPQHYFILFAASGLLRFVCIALFPKGDRKLISFR